MTTAEVPAVGDQVICADGEPLGTVEADEGTHLRVRRPHERPPLVWVPKRIIGERAEGVLHLLLDRDELHDGVIALSPARQREYGTLEALSLALRRHRAAGPVPAGAAGSPAPSSAGGPH